MGKPPSHPGNSIQVKATSRYLKRMNSVKMALGVKVEVAGTWTAIPWQPIPCELSLDGLWEKELNLGKGVYEYKFLVNGVWFLDPSKPTVRHQNGITNNILTVEGTHNVNRVLEEEIKAERAQSEEIEKCHKDVNEVSSKEICIDKAWSDKIGKGYEDVNNASGEAIEIDIASDDVEKGEEIEIRKPRLGETETGYEYVLATSAAMEDLSCEAIDPTGVQDEDLSSEFIATKTFINDIYEAEGRQEEVKAKQKDETRTEQETDKVSGEEIKVRRNWSDKIEEGYENTLSTNESRNQIGEQNEDLSNEAASADDTNEAGDPTRDQEKYLLNERNVIQQGAIADDKNEAGDPIREQEECLSDKHNVIQQGSTASDT